jgi:membrane protease YdiL (CAAX protease family)
MFNILQERTMFARKATPASSDVPIDARHSRTQLFGAVLVLIVFQSPLPRLLVRGQGLSAYVGREAVFWVMTLFLIVYVGFIERRPMSSIGLKRPTWKSVAYGLAGAFTMIAGMALVYMVVFPALGLMMRETQMDVIKSMPLWFRVSLIARAAVFEEIYYRGFAIERLTELTGFRWLAALISLAAFTFAHLAYWGWAHLIVAAFGGAVLTVLYLFRRDLACNMVAHLVTDGVGFLFG